MVPAGPQARAIGVHDLKLLVAAALVDERDARVRDAGLPGELLDEIEDVLKIQCAPMTWPISMGKRFRGVYHLYNDTVAFFDPQAEKGTSEIIKGIDNPRLNELIPDQVDEMRSEVELVRGASHTFDRAAYLAGKQTPVFFGSASNNFGVQSLLDAVVDLSPPPQPRAAIVGGAAIPAADKPERLVEPDEEKFSGFDKLHVLDLQIDVGALLNFFLVGGSQLGVARLCFRRIGG